MTFALYLCGRLARPFAGAICATLIAVAGQLAYGQERPAPVVQKASPAKSTDSPASTKPASVAPAAKAASTPASPSADSRLTFSFRYQPWQDVLDWFAQQAGLSLLMESPPH